MLLLITGFALLQHPVNAQTSVTTKSEDEKLIRSLIEKFNDGERMEFTDSIVIVNPFLPSPQIGKQRTEAELKIWSDVKKERSHEKLIRYPRRIEIAEAGDMAYEFGNYTVDYDNPKNEHVHNEGSYISIWRKVNGKWMVEIIFNRYNHTPSQMK